MSAAEVHIVGDVEHWVSLLLRRVPRALCGELLDGDDPTQEPTEASPLCVLCSRRADLPWWWPLHCAIHNARNRVAWAVLGAPSGIGWEVSRTADGLEAQGLRHSGRFRQVGHHVAWVHGETREDVERQAIGLFPGEEQDFLWNDDEVGDHLCTRFPTAAA